MKLPSSGLVTFHHETINHLHGLVTINHVSIITDT